MGTNGDCLLAGIPRLEKDKRKKAMISHHVIQDYLKFCELLTVEEEMATHSSILAWKIPRMEEPGGLQFMGDCSCYMTECTHTHTELG